MIECQEPDCRYEATKDWNGMKECSDHYDQYKGEYEKMVRKFSH